MPLNLVQDRQGPNVWERNTSEWDAERWLTATAAGALLLAALRGRSGTGWMLVAGSGVLAYWAGTSSEARRERRRQLTAVWPFRRREDDLVSEASEESFPASDAPALTPPGMHAH